MTTIIIESVIKINLALHIIGQEENGYHQLQSLVTFAPEGDVIEVSPSAEDEIILAGEYGLLLSVGEDNLIVKARNVLRACLHQPVSPVRVKLIKRLPPASGLGGGSADAAAVLLALTQIWQAPISEEALYDLAGQLGADVPMCLCALQHKQPLMVRGIGEKLTPLPDFPALDMVIINPNKQLATGAVFAALRQKNNPEFELSPHKEGENLANLRNDLEQPARALMPEILDIIQELEISGAHLARMSGSGASCFGLYDNRAQAQAAAATLKSHHPDYFVIQTRSFGRE